MNTKNLSDKNLLESIEVLVKKEKQFTMQIIEHLEEIQRRKVFLERGCSSLFIYCTKILKYSAAEAHHRIYAMKLTKQAPIAKDKISSGKLSLTNSSKIAAHMERNKIKSPEVAASLVEKLCEKTTREAEVILFDLLPSEARKTIRIEIDVHTHQKLEEYRKKFGTYTDEEIIKKLLDQALDTEEKIITVPKTTLIPAAKNSRYIPTFVKRQVLLRSQSQCESLLRESNIRCNEKRGLEFDHIRPYAWGGTNELSNIRLLCRNCNQRAAFKLFGDSYKAIDTLAVNG